MKTFIHLLRQPRLALLVLLALSGMLALWSCRGSNSAPEASVSVAYAPFEPTGLLWIAEGRGFFTRNGLRVSLRKYDTGAGSLAAVLNGEADMAVGVSEFPVVRNAFQKKDMSIVASADKVEFVYLIGRKDRGIQRMSDVRGKQIGVALGTIAEFHLGRLLELNGIGKQEVAIVDLKTPDQWVNAVVDGEVDAVVTAQPDANTVKERLGDNAFLWPAQAGQFLHGLIVSTNEWTAKHPGTLIRFLQSLRQAEEYALRDPPGAKALVQKGLDLDSKYMETAWSQNRFALSLDQSLILAMEDEARWIIANNLTAEKVVPNFLEYIDVAALRTAKPGTVKIAGK